MDTPKKELFEMIIGKNIKKVTFNPEDEKFHYEEEGKKRGEKTVGMYKFMNLCKKWAVKRKFYISSGLLSEDEAYASAKYHPDGALSSQIRRSETIFKDTETEAAISAVEWCVKVLEDLKEEEEYRQDRKNKLLKDLKKRFEIIVDIDEDKKTFGEGDGQWFMQRVSVMFDGEDSVAFGTFDVGHTDIRNEKELPEYLEHLIRIFLNKWENFEKHNMWLEGFSFEDFEKGVDENKAFERQRLKWERERLRGTEWGMAAESVRPPDLKVLNPVK